MASAGPSDVASCERKFETRPPHQPLAVVRDNAELVLRVDPEPVEADRVVPRLGHVEMAPEELLVVGLLQHLSEVELDLDSTEGHGKDLGAHHMRDDDGLL